MKFKKFDRVRILESQGSALVPGDLATVMNVREDFYEVIGSRDHRLWAFDEKDVEDADKVLPKGQAWQRKQAIEKTQVNYAGETSHSSLWKVLSKSVQLLKNILVTPTASTKRTTS